MREFMNKYYLSSLRGAAGREKDGKWKGYEIPAIQIHGEGTGWGDRAVLLRCAVLGCEVQ